VLVIVENIESDPFVVPAGPVFPIPPPPTVTGKEVPPVNVNFVPPGKEVR
jgi:hypothetical protein